MSSSGKIDKYDTYITVVAPSGKSYYVTYCFNSSIINSTIQVLEVEKRFGNYKKKTRRAFITFNNERGSGAEKDETLLKEAIRNNGYSMPFSILTSSNRRVAEIIGKCLSINDEITLDILKSFDNASWDTKAKSIVSLYFFAEEEKEKALTKSNTIDDQILEKKIKALEAYREISR